MNCSIFSKNKKSRGFTLVELIVVMTIFVVITTALVINHNKWNDNLIVSTQAYEMDLMLRQAQIYALGVRENLGGAGGDNFNVAYGIFFGPLSSEATGSDAWTKRYIFFADINGNGIYDEGIDNVIETKSLSRGVTIDRFCGTKGVGQENDMCAPGQGNVVFMYVSFVRPEPKARIILLNNGKNVSSNTTSPALIYLKSPGGKYFRVGIGSNGQIFTDQSTPS